MACKFFFREPDIQFSCTGKKMETGIGDMPDLIPEMIPDNITTALPGNHPVKEI